MQRLVQRADGDYVLTLPVLSADGEPLSGTPTAPASVVVVDGAGTEVWSGTPQLGAGVVTASVPASSMPLLDSYTATWTATIDGETRSWVTRVELCGARLFGLAELRASYQEVASLTDDELDLARLRAEERLEAAARIAFCPRGGRATVLGDGTSRLILPVGAGLRRLYSVSVEGVPLTSDELNALEVREWGALDRSDGSVWPAGGLVSVHYEHGLDLPVPGPVSVATMVLAREYIIRSALSSRAMGESTELGFLRLSVADGDARPTGIPEVDAVIAAYGRRRPVVA